MMVMGAVLSDAAIFNPASIVARPSDNSATASDLVTRKTFTRPPDLETRKIATSSTREAVVTEWVAMMTAVPLSTNCSLSPAINAEIMEGCSTASTSSSNSKPGWHLPMALWYAAKHMDRSLFPSLS